MINEFLQYIDGDLFQRKDLIIFDIGSRDCEQSIEFYHKFPNARIFAFECNPNTLPICRKNIENYQDRITLIEGAVCDYDGEITFYPIDQEKPLLHGSMETLAHRLYSKVVVIMTVSKHMFKMRLLPIVIV